METKPLSFSEGEEVKKVIIKRRLKTMAKSHAKAFALLIKLWLRGEKTKSMGFDSLPTEGLLSAKSQSAKNPDDRNSKNIENRGDEVSEIEHFSGYL